MIIKELQNKLKGLSEDSEVIITTGIDLEKYYIIEHVTFDAFGQLFIEVTENIIENKEEYGKIRPWV